MKMLDIVPLELNAMVRPENDIEWDKLDTYDLLLKLLARCKFDLCSIEPSVMRSSIAGENREF